MIFITVPKPAAEDSSRGGGLGGQGGDVELSGDGSEYGMRIYSLSYNSISEQADALSGSTAYSTAVDGSLGSATGTPEKVAGYSKNAGTVGSGSIVDNYSGGTTAIDDEQKHPVNEEGLLKATAEYEITPAHNYNGSEIPDPGIVPTNANSLTGAAADSWGALNSDAGQDPQAEVLSRLLIKNLTFDKDNAFLQKIIFCRSEGAVLLSPYTNNVGTIANNAPLFVSAETFGRVYATTHGPHDYKNENHVFIRSQISKIDAYTQSFSHLSGGNALVPEDFLNPIIV